MKTLDIIELEKNQLLEISGGYGWHAHHDATAKGFIKSCGEFVKNFTEGFVKGYNEATTNNPFK